MKERCMCGDSECWSCGTAQGTRTSKASVSKRSKRLVTFAYLVMTDGKESVMQVARGILTKRNTINLNARTTEDVAKVTVEGRLEGVHRQLANRYSTPPSASMGGVMTQTDIAIQMAAELAAESAVDCFGEDIPNAQTAWDFINEQVYCEDGIDGAPGSGGRRPLHLPDTMPRSFGPLYLVAAAKLINRPQFYECGICGAHHNASWDGDCREDGARFQTEDLDAKYGAGGWGEVLMPGSEDDSDPIQRLIRAVVAGMEYDPGHSDLDDEQPIHVRMTLGDYRLACRLQAPEYKVTFLSENGTRCTLGNQGDLTAEAAAKIAAANNEECPSAECRVERV